MHDIRQGDQPRDERGPTKPDMAGGIPPNQGDRPVPREQPAASTPAPSPPPPSRDPVPGHGVPAPQHPPVNLHPEHAGQAPTPQSPTPPPPADRSDWTSGPSARPIRDGASYEVTGVEPIPEPAPAAPAPAPSEPIRTAPSPEDASHHSLVRSLRTIKFGLLAMVVILAAAVLYFSTQGSPKPADTGSGGGSSQQGPANAPTEGTGQPRAISCVGTTGSDASTDSQTFQDIEGTECSYRTGETAETLVLNGKLTGRNTEGTGMSVSINVNGKVCSGGETLNYARTYTPMVSNCVFEVPAGSSVAIKWQFLSPFGGSASVLRSSKNIAPSITGVAVPKTEEGSQG